MERIYVLLDEYLASVLLGSGHVVTCEHGVCLLNASCLQCHRLDGPEVMATVSKSDAGVNYSAVQDGWPA